jgi:hypothetical protein
MDSGEVAMIVTLKKQNGVWVVGCLDGTARVFAEFLDAASFAAAEFERAAYEAIGWGVEVAVC